MKRAIFYSADGEVAENVEIYGTVDPTRCVVVDKYPDLVPKEGFSAKLVVRDGTLQWEYVENPVVPDTPTETEQLRADVDYLAALGGVTL